MGKLNFSLPVAELIMVTIKILTGASPNESRVADYLALGSLFLFMLFICSITWQKWGSLTVDCGREMYVPAAMNEGKRLYFDIWYPYGPLIPYWNAFLFRLFGTHLSVLYASGIAIIVIISLTLYSLSRIFLPVCLSFTAVFAFILQAFQLNIFNYVLPYSYAAAYGSMLLIVLLWLLIQDCFREQIWRIFAAGQIAGLILLTKIEFGVAAYGFLISAIAIRASRTKSVVKFTQDIVICVPGFMVSIGIYGSLVSMSSFAFIFEENIITAPHSYFISTFGKMWAQQVGFTTDIFSLIKSILKGLLSAVGLLSAIWIASLYRTALVILTTLSLGLCSFHLSVIFVSTILEVDLPPILMRIAPFFFFNTGLIWLSVMLLIITIIKWWRTGQQSFDSAVLMLTICAITIGFRVLTKMNPAGYSIFYDTTAYLSWLVALYTLSRYLPTQPTVRIWKSFSLLLCCGLIVITISDYRVDKRQFLISSPRGSIYTDQWTGKAYIRLLTFLDSVKSRSGLFVTMPEDISLYYFSSNLAPSRWHTLSPGILPPGELTLSYLQELDRIKVKYVILSNRSTSEYGVPVFGEDYNQTVYQWLEQNYKVIEQVGDYERKAYPSHWGALIYERN